MHKIEINNITKKFGSRTVLDSISYTFESGKIYVIKGTSGSGKTTLLNIMSGLLKPDAGTIVTSFGKNTDADWFRRKASYVFQDYALIEDDTVKENLRLATRFKRENRNKKSFLSTLRIVGLGDILEQKVFELSGGEQQRLSISRLFLRDFEVVFADEPTGNLDEENTKTVIELLKKLAKDQKIVIVSSHNPILFEMADEVIELEWL